MTVIYFMKPTFDVSKMFVCEIVTLKKSLMSVSNWAAAELLQSVVNVILPVWMFGIFWLFKTVASFVIVPI